MEQGREVFAVPGMAHHYRSVGPHRLLKQGAKLVESAEDVIEEIRPLIRRSSPPPAATERENACEGLAPDEAAIVAGLDEEPRHIDEISRALDWPVSKVMAILLTLELKGVVRQLPGKYFVHFRNELCRKS